MAWFAGLVAFLKALPSIIEALKKLGELVEDGVHYVDVRIQLGKFDKAADKAQKDKDTSGLEDLFKNQPGSGSH